MAQSILAVVLAVPSMLWEAWVEKTLWWWFAVPLGLPAITLAHAFGISMLLVCITGKIGIGVQMQTDTKHTTLVKMIGVMIGFAFALLMGWVAHRFMQ